MSVISETQMPKSLRNIVDEEVKYFNQVRKISIQNSIPETSGIPSDNPLHWLRIPDVICVFVDMKGSTEFSASTRDKDTAGAYQLFTGTAVRMFHDIEAPYIDVRGDGVFALFNSNQVYRAIAAAVSFKTFAELEFLPKIKARLGEEKASKIGTHIGIDQKTVLVRRVGLRRYRDRDDRRNDVWAGKPVNMAAKLAARSEPGTLLVSDRYYDRIKDDLVRKSCGCTNGNIGGEKAELWKKEDLPIESVFDFDSVYCLGSRWCTQHGNQFYDDIVALDEGNANNHHRRRRI